MTGASIVVVPSWNGLVTPKGSVGGVTAVDVEDMAGDERSLVRCDEDDRVGKLLREAEATHWNSRHQCRLVFRRAGKAGQHAGVRGTGRHDVDTDSRLGDLQRHRLGDAFDGVLAAHIDRGPW